MTVHSMALGEMNNHLYVNNVLTMIQINIKLT